MKIIDKYYKEFDDDAWTRISIVENLSLNNIRKFKDKLNWISFTDVYNYIDDNFVEEFKDYIESHKDLMTVSDRELKYIKEYKDRKEKK